MTFVIHSSVVLAGSQSAKRSQVKPESQVSKSKLANLSVIRIPTTLLKARAESK